MERVTADYVFIWSREIASSLCSSQRPYGIYNKPRLCRGLLYPYVFASPDEVGGRKLTHSPCNSSEIFPFDRLRACPVLDTCEQIGRSLLHAISTGVGNDESAYCILKVIWNSSGIVSKLMKCCRRLAPGHPVSLKLKLKHACSNTGIMN